MTTTTMQNKNTEHELFILKDRSLTPFSSMTKQYTLFLLTIKNLPGISAQVLKQNYHASNEL